MTARVVYKHVAADGAVLYVGLSKNLADRTRRHRRLSPWWPLVDRVEIASEHDDYLEAGLAEALLINELRPPYNVKGGNEWAWYGEIERQERASAHFGVPVAQFIAPLDTQAAS